MDSSNRIKSRRVFAGIEILAAVILASSFVSAFAVSSAYWQENPLIMNAGEVANIQLTLQNLASDDEVVVRAEVVSGSEVVEISDFQSVYRVPGGGKTKVNLEVTIPSGAQIGDKYSVDIRFTTITNLESAPLGLGSSIGQRFDVIVGPLPSEPELSPGVGSGVILWVAIAIVITLLIVWFLVRRKKELLSGQERKQKNIGQKVVLSSKKNK